MAQERRGDLEMICQGMPGKAATSTAQLSELPSPVSTHFESKRHNSTVTTLAAKPSQASLSKKPTETWYSVGSEGSGSAEASQSFAVCRAQDTGESSRETWYSDATLREADAYTTTPYGQPF